MERLANCLNFANKSILKSINKTAVIPMTCPDSSGKWKSHNEALCIASENEMLSQAEHDEQMVYISTVLNIHEVNAYDMLQTENHSCSTICSTSVATQPCSIEVHWLVTKTLT